MQFSLLENILTVLFLIAVVLSKNTNTDTSQTVYLQNTNAATGLVETEAVHQITFQDMEHPKMLRPLRLW